MEACLGLDIPVHVLIRPRGGGFVYDRDEIEVMRHDIRFARDFAGGVVLGLLDDEGRVHRGRTSELVELARPLSVTFHKAFDAARDPFEALDDLIELGVDRVLTSGGAPTAREGLPVLAELTRRAAGRITIMAGGSIKLEDIRPLIDAGLREIHVGSAACRDGVTDPSTVGRILERANA
jgi:copper homeostasis protein